MKRLHTVAMIAFFSVTAFLSAEIYRVGEVLFKTNDELENYFEKHEKRSISFRGIMKAEAENDMLAMKFDVRKKGDSIFVDAIVRDKKRGTLEFFKNKDGIYVTEKGKSVKFFELRFDGDTPLIKTGRWIKLNKPQKVTEDYLKLKEQYGDDVQGFVTELVLVPEGSSELLSLNVNKVFKINEVEMKIYEDVITFGERFVPDFAAYKKNSEDMFEEMWIGKMFRVLIDGNAITIKSEKSEDSYIFNGRLEKIDDRTLRAHIYGTYYDFHLRNKIEEDFNVLYIEKGEFIELDKRFEEKKGYDKLTDEYGKKLPYNAIIQYVEEVPVKESKN